MSERFERMISYLPRYYQSSEIIKEIIELQQSHLDEEDRERNEVFEQFILETATWSIERWEKEVAIVPLPGDSLELRRAKVRAKLVSRPPMNINKMRALINSFIPSRTAKVRNIPNEYAFEASVPLYELQWFHSMLEAVEKAKHAHLEFVLAPMVKETVEIHDKITVNLRRYHKVSEFRVGMKPMKYQNEEVL